jgi:hypothetical protein
MKERLSSFSSGNHPLFCLRIGRSKEELSRGEAERTYWRKWFLIAIVSSEDGLIVIDFIETAWLLRL